MIHIENLFCSEPQGVICFVGAGGKTSLMFHLASLLVQAGHRVLTTTTTKISVPSPEQSETLFVDPDPKTIITLSTSCRRCSPHITAASAYLSDSAKLKGFSPDDIVVFDKSGIFDWIIVEGDGAAGCSLKAPAAHEPVIPSNATVVVAVAALDVIGRPLSEKYVFRPELVGKLAGINENEIVDEDALARFFSRPNGAFKNSPSSSRRFIFLNKADDYERQTAGVEIAEQLRRKGSPPAETLIVGQAAECIVVHSTHHLVMKK